MKFTCTVLYVDDVPAVMDFYRRVFGLETRFYDEALQFAELETGSAPLALASHQLGEMLMPGQYRRPGDGQPSSVEVVSSRVVCGQRSQRRSRREPWLWPSPMRCRGEQR